MGMTQDTSRYRALIRDLAERAIELAVDASPHRPREGEIAISLTKALPLAERQLGRASSLELISEHLLTAAREMSQVDRRGGDASEVLRTLDGRGHQREVYRWLMLDLFAQVADEQTRSRLSHELLVVEVSGTPWTSERGNNVDPSFVVWSALRSLRAGIDADSLRSVWDEVIGGPGSCRPLHEQTPHDSPDEWTYRELTGLHGLHHLANLTAHEPWRQRVLEITSYHQQHTQPDYTTYQPWALAAFLSNPETTWFAEQQLHDVQTHLSIEGGPGAVVPALLLADAYASLSA